MHKCEKCNKEFKSADSLNQHNYARHKELYKQPKLLPKQKKKIRNIVIAVAIIAVIALLIYWKSIPPKNAPIIEISPDRYSFGSVSQSEGVVSTVVAVRNIGNEDLVLNNLDTTCGCTSASIIHDGKESPKFGMASHGTNPKNWQEVLAPGESVELKIYYDPNVHKDMRGAVSRGVNVYSNDPRNKAKSVTISAVQVD